MSTDSSKRWRLAIDALQLKIPKEDPWLTKADNHHGAHEQNAVRTSMKQQLHLLTLVAKLAFVDTNFADDSPRNPSRTGLLQFRFVPRIDGAGGKLKYRMKCIFINRWSILVIVCLCIIYPMAKMQFGCYLLFSRDNLLSLAIRTSSLYNATKCVRESELSEANKRFRKQLDTIEPRIRQLGVCSSYPTLSLSEHGLVSFAPIVFYLYSGVVLSLRSYRIDHIKYLFDPIGERKRLSRSLNLIVQVMIGSIMLTSSRYLSHVRALSITSIKSGATDQWSASMPIRSLMNWMDDCDVSRSHRQHGNQTLYSFQGCEYFRILFDYKVRQQYIQILRSIVDRQLVRPVCFTLKWHMHLVCLARLSIVNMFGICFLCPLASLVAFALIELSSKTNARLDMLNCTMHTKRDNYSGGAILLQRYKFLPNLTTDDEALYSTCLQSIHVFSSIKAFLTKAYLMFVIESKYYITGQAVSFVIASVSVGLALATGATFYCLVYLIGMVNKLAWLEQISRQLRYCLNLEHGTLRSSDEPGDPIKHFPFSSKTASGPNVRRGTDEYLVYLMTITMINFELFRREYKPFHKTANFLALQMCLYCSPALIYCYALLNYSLQENRTALVFAIMSLSMTMNLYIGYSSYMASRVGGLMRNITQLVSLFPAQDHYKEQQSRGEGKEKSRHLMLIAIALWRRYLLSEDETKKYFAPDLFGSYLDYMRLISLNAYTVALFMLLWRPDP